MCIETDSWVVPLQFRIRSHPINSDAYNKPNPPKLHLHSTPPLHRRSATQHGLHAWRLVCFPGSFLTQHPPALLAPTPCSHPCSALNSSSSVTQLAARMAHQQQLGGRLEPVKPRPEGNRPTALPSRDLIRAEWWLNMENLAYIKLVHKKAD